MTMRAWLELDPAERAFWDASWVEYIKELNEQ